MSNARRKLNRRKNSKPFYVRLIERQIALTAAINGVPWPPQKLSKRSHSMRLRQRKRAIKQFRIKIEVVDLFSEALNTFRRSVAEVLHPAFEKLAAEVSEALRGAHVDNAESQA
jgi:hypothetical protein